MGRFRLRGSGELVKDCEAFLGGHLAERLGHRRLGHRRAAVPAWAWMNLLAHGSAGELEAAAADHPRLARSSHWQRARSYLATEVLRSAQINGSLASVQTSLLVPLELEIASRSEATRWEAQRLVAAVEAVLHRDRAGSTRPMPQPGTRDWKNR